MHIPDRAEVGSFCNGATHFHRCITHRAVLVDIELLNHARSRKMLIYIPVTFAEETYCEAFTPQLPLKRSTPVAYLW